LEGNKTPPFLDLIHKYLIFGFDTQIPHFWIKYTNTSFLK